jgi:protein-tyrosine-phosphatase
MRRRGLDVSQHRSTATTSALVNGADVIITAERDHVVKIAALSPAAFRRSMTLPEFLARAADQPGTPEQGGVRAWVESLTATRTAAGYLRDPIPEVADPTGSSPRAFEAATVEIERQCAEASALLMRHS